MNQGSSINNIAQLIIQAITNTNFHQDLKKTQKTSPIQTMVKILNLKENQS